MAIMANSSSDILVNTSSYNQTILICLALVLIISIGVIGNGVNLVVFGSESMRRTSTFRFLLYLSVLDLLVLLVCATDALINLGLGIEIRLESELACRLHTFATYFLGHSSSIVLMVIGVDRALVMTNRSIWPICHKNHSASTTSSRRRRSTYYSPSNNMSSRFAGGNKLFVFKCFIDKLHRIDPVVLVILLALFLLNSHYLVFMNLNEIKEDPESMLMIENQSMLPPPPSSFLICFPPPDTIYFKFLTEVWIWIDLVVFCILPFLIMCFSSMVILVKINAKTKKFVNVLMVDGLERNKSAIYRRIRRNRQLLYMLLLTNLYFLLSMLPYGVAFVSFQGEKSESPAQLVVHMILYTNNAVNFLFYGLSSQRYREVLCKRFNRNRRAGSGGARRSTNAAPTITIAGVAANDTMMGGDSNHMMTAVRLSQTFRKFSIRKDPV